MFEELIAMLDGMGGQYTEDPEMGTVTIDVENLDKVQVLDLIKALADWDMDYTLEGMMITVSPDEMEEPMMEEPAPAEAPMDEEDAQAAALNQMMGM